MIGSFMRFVWFGIKTLIVAGLWAGIFQLGVAINNKAIEQGEAIINILIFLQVIAVVYVILARYIAYFSKNKDRLTVIQEATYGGAFVAILFPVVSFVSGLFSSKMSTGLHGTLVVGSVVLIPLIIRSVTKSNKCPKCGKHYTISENSYDVISRDEYVKFKDGQKGIDGLGSRRDQAITYIREARIGHYACSSCGYSYDKKYTKDEELSRTKL